MDQWCTIQQNKQYSTRHKTMNSYLCDDVLVFPGECFKVELVPVPVPVHALRCTCNSSTQEANSSIVDLYK